MQLEKTDKPAVRVTVYGDDVKSKTFSVYGSTPDQVLAVLRAAVRRASKSK